MRSIRKILIFIGLIIIFVFLAIPWTLWDFVRNCFPILSVLIKDLWAMAEYKLLSVEPCAIYGRTALSLTDSERVYMFNVFKNTRISAEIREHESGKFDIALSKEDYEKLPKDREQSKHYIPTREGEGYFLYVMDKEVIKSPIIKNWYKVGY